MGTEPDAARRLLEVTAETWDIAGRFTIARGAKTKAHVVVAHIHQGAVTGRGECVPYARYGESVQGVRAAIQKLAGPVAAGLTRDELRQLLPPGAARNAVDCALWDLEAKLACRTVAELAGHPPLQPVLTAYTLSLATPQEMAAKARSVPHYPLLKLKLGQAGDPEGDAARLAAVRAARPDARLVVDANEGWREENLAAMLEMCAAHGVELVEQPLPQGADALLADIPHPVPVCADESAHHSDQVTDLCGRYEALNIKLDKTGGLTDALVMAETARARGMKIMCGCMVATSLAMAPALLIAQRADWVDLDGPLLLARDRPHGLTFDGATISPPASALWG